MIKNNTYGQVSLIAYLYLALGYTPFSCNKSKRDTQFGVLAERAEVKHTTAYLITYDGLYDITHQSPQTLTVSGQSIKISTFKDFIQGRIFPGHLSETKCFIGPIQDL